MEMIDQNTTEIPTTIKHKKVTGTLFTAFLSNAVIT